MLIHNQVLRSLATDSDWHIWNEVVNFLIAIRNNTRSSSQNQKIRYRCHSLCRAIADNIHDLRVADGEFTGVIIEEGDPRRICMTHSWLVTQDGAIIDPYPCGYLSIGPILVVTKGECAYFGGNLYAELGEDFTREVMTPEMLKETEDLKKFFRGALSS